MADLTEQDLELIHRRIIQVCPLRKIKAIPDERSDPPKRPQKRREAPKKTQA